MSGMMFNGVRKPYLTVLRGRKRPSWAPIKRNILTVPGLAGGLLESTDILPRPEDVPILIKGIDITDLQRIKEDLAAWLVTDEPAPLVFDDEPSRIYYAVIDGSFDPDEIVNRGKGVLNFICPSSYKYSAEEKKATFVEAATFNVGGTAETFPVIRVKIKKDTTFLAVGNGDKINMIGNPAQVTQQPFVREERKLWNELGTLVGWADTTSVEDGKILGTMKTNGYSFYTDTYGSDAAWHGPAKKISVGSTIQDFQVDALIRQLGSSGQVGSIEIALLDASNKFIGKMLMTKRSVGSLANWALLRAGTSLNGYDFLNTRGATENTWANFNGMLRIARVGNVWTAYVCLIDDKGVQHTRAGATWVDSKGIASAPVAQIQVQLWQYGTTPATSQYIDDIKVFKINSPADNQIPYVARVDDIIDFDHVNDKILRNGELITKDKAFIGEYFALQPGTNAIVVEPAEAIESTEVRWPDRWR